MLGSQLARSESNAQEAAFITKVITSCMFAQATAEVAIKRDVEGSLLAFCNNVLRHHTVIENDMRVLGRLEAIKLPVALPSELYDNVIGLREVKPEEFAERFLQYQIACSHSLVEELEDAAVYTQNESMRALIQQHIPVLKELHEEAINLDAVC